MRTPFSNKGECVAESVYRYLAVLDCKFINVCSNNCPNITLIQSKSSVRVQFINMVDDYPILLIVKWCLGGGGTDDLECPQEDFSDS